MQRGIRPISIPVQTTSVAALRTAGAAVTKTTADFQRAVAVTDTLDRVTKKTNASLLGLGSTSARVDAALLGLRTAAGSAAVIGLGAGALAAIAFGKALRATLGLTAQFETQLNTFRAVTGATAEEMERVSAAAEELGADISLPAVSAGDAAEAMTELAKAGLSVQDAIDGTRGVLQLATAAAISNAQAVELAANALNAFGLAGDQAGRVADVFANAANAAQGSIADIGIAFQQAAAVGRQVGLSFEDTGVFLTALAQAGLRGSDAGTSLRTALIRLINPTDEAKAKIAELGIQIRDMQGNLRPDIFLQFAAATRDLTPAARDATFALVGGQDAIRAFSILGRQSISTFIRLRRELREQGTAAEVAAARTEGLGGAASALRSTLETVAITIGSRVSPGITDFVNGITASISAIAGSEQVTETLNDSLTLVGSSLNLVGQAATAAGAVLLPLADAFQQVTSAIGVGTILAGFAAFKLAPRIIIILTRAVYGLNFALAGIQAKALAASTGLTGLARATAISRAAFASIGTSLATFARSVTGVALAIGLVTAGLVFLLTRQSATEKATKAFGQATDDLTDALGRQRQATDALASAQSSVGTEQLSVAQAKLARDLARSALATSDANKGSFERRQLALNLAVATQDVTFAEERYADALRAVVTAQEEADQASRNADTARQAELATINSLIAAEQERAALSGGRFAPGPTIGAEAEAIDRVVASIRERAAVQRAANTEESRDLAKRLELLARFIEKTEELPEEQEYRIIFDTREVEGAVRGLRDTFKLGAETSIQAFLDGLKAPPEEFRRSMADPIHAALRDAGPRFRETGAQAALSVLAGFVNAMRARVQDLANATVNELKAAMKRAAGSAESLETQLDIIIGGGAGPEEQLRLLKQRLKERQREFEAAQKAFRISPGNDALKQAFEDAAAARRQAFEDVRNIEEQLARDAETAADKISEAAEERDKAFIEGLAGAETKARNAVVLAEAREGLRDDIASQRRLRQVLLQQVRVDALKIKDLTLRRDFLRDTRAKIVQLFADIKKDQQALAEELERQAEERRERILEGIRLDIEFAQIRENRAAEINARQRLIKQLQKEQALVERGSVEWKRLRNAIRAEKEAIEKLRGESKSRSDAFAGLAFEFLQTQRGFAPNLLSNLIPQGATAGLVGNISIAGGVTPGISAGAAPGAELPARAAIKEADSRTTTRGQTDSMIVILREIRGILQRLAGENDHPEATRARKVGAAAMFTME